MNSLPTPHAGFVPTTKIANAATDGQVMAPDMQIVWAGRFGEMVIEVRGGIPRVNGQPIVSEPPGEGADRRLGP